MVFKKKILRQHIDQYLYELNFSKLFLIPYLITSLPNA